MEELRYSTFEAHAVTISDDEVVLDFLTAMDGDGSYITGAIIVDIRKLNGRLRPVRFWCQPHWGASWLEAWISDGLAEARLSASLLFSPALENLIEAVISLLLGTKTARCFWEEEPGQYRWLFERHGDELLDLLCREAERFGLHLHRRGAELRQRVAWHLSQLGDAEQQHADCERDDEATRPETRGDEPTHHGSGVPS